ncbi:hypothetical protein [Thalassotalea aquiviva]|uniref:hypothetical protein n=1 Tax=Thalassotalea aquiviva TaxID=3242415 RepID=UPI00352B98D5
MHISRTQRFLGSVTILVALLLFSHQSLAQQPQQQSPQVRSLSFFVGERSSDVFRDDHSDFANVDFYNDTNFGLIFSWPYDHYRDSSLLYSVSNTKFKPAFDGINNHIGIHYLHLGGQVSLYHGLLPIKVTGGLGVTHFSPNETRLDSETKPSAHLGIGTELLLTNRLSFRVDARIYATLFNTDGAIFCSANQCLIQTSSRVWYQGEFSAGITLRF